MTSRNHEKLTIEDSNSLNGAFSADETKLSTMNKGASQKITITSKRNSLKRRNSILLSADDIVKVFSELDYENTGRLTSHNMVRAFKKLHLPVESHTLAEFMEHLDSDLDGHISFAEYVRKI